MKRILFVIGNMDMGGTRTSLLNLLHHLAEREDLSVDVLVLSHYGPLLDQLPQGVRLLPECFEIAEAVSGKKQGPAGKLYHILVYLLKKVFGYRRVFRWIYRRVAKRCAGFCPEYDAVFGYQEGLSNDCAAQINAKKHYTWIHSNLEVWYSEQTFQSSTYDRADNIIFVADKTKEAFGKQFPQYAGKSIVIQNTLNTAKLLEKSKLPAQPLRKEEEKVLVSVGRVFKEKAFERIIPVSQYLTEKLINFRWYLIGDGPQLESIQKLIEEHDLTQWITLLGNQNNPYNYVAQADLLVVTSITESQPMVILEALTLGIPVVTTRYPSAEQLLNGQSYGLICENDETSIGEAIHAILTDGVTLQNMKVAAASYEYDNNRIINKVIELC